MARFALKPKGVKELERTSTPVEGLYFVEQTLNGSIWKGWVDPITGLGIAAPDPSPANLHAMMDELINQAISAVCV